MQIARAIITILLVFVGFSAHAQTQFTVRVPTSFVEDNIAISLEMVVFKPINAGDGPFPTLVFNHGSTGRGDKPDSFSKTRTFRHIANYFNSRGWLVVFPQRRGRGKSDGLYNEGFTEDRSRYSISPKRSLLGLNRALEDLDEVVNYLKKNPMINSNQMLIGGVSRGGILSIVYAGTRPNIFNGAVNFVGGWIGNFSGSGIYRLFYDYLEKINTVSFIKGADFQKPTIWLYGENDSFYSLEHSKNNFDAFISAGGLGTFHSYSLGNDKNGHYLASYPHLWVHDLDVFVNKLK